MKQKVGDNTSWIVVVSDGKLSSLCKKCKVRCAPNLPMPVLSYVKFLEGFRNSHLDCKEGMGE